MVSTSPSGPAPATRTLVAVSNRRRFFGDSVARSEAKCKTSQSNSYHSNLRAHDPTRSCTRSNRPIDGSFQHRRLRRISPGPPRTGIRTIDSSKDQSRRDSGLDGNGQDPDSRQATQPEGRIRPAIYLPAPARRRPPVLWQPTADDCPPKTHSMLAWNTDSRMRNFPNLDQDTAGGISVCGCGR